MTEDAITGEPMINEIWWVVSGAICFLSMCAMIVVYMQTGEYDTFFGGLATLTAILTIFFKKFTGF